MHIVVHPSFNREETLLKYSQTECVRDVRELRHPIARQLLIDWNMSGLEIASVADVPSGTGLSTSSAYTVGLIHAMCALNGVYHSQEWIAARACEVEIDKLKEPIGKQDQYGTAIGGLKFIRFMCDGRVDIEPMILRSDCIKILDENLLLFYTGLNHSAGSILKEQNVNIVSDYEKFNNLVKMTELTYELKEAMLSENLRKVGEILNTGWLLKRELAGSISNSVIDEYYNLAIKNGAIGGKLLGAGGGGFLLFYCEKANQQQLRHSLSNLIELPFSLESGGTRVIYVGD
jgi:D-glycero-alpha-D-manno-heptose-7-phosphate kinase